MVTCVIIAGALVRYFYNMCHVDHAQGAVVGVVRRGGGDVGGVLDRDGGFAGHAARARPRRRPPRSTRRVDAAAKAPADVVAVVRSRCSMCHAPEPVWEGIGEAPKGVLLDTPEHIARFAPAIRMQAVLTHAMPPNNLTEITPEERAVLARWLGVGKVAQN